VVKHLRPTERHLPYEINDDCYLPPDTVEPALSQPQPDRPVLDLSTPEGWKAELISPLVTADSHPYNNYLLAA